MTEVCALVGLRNLEKVDFILTSRARNAARYVEFFGELEDRGLLRQMKIGRGVDCPYLYFPLLLHEEASAFVRYMQAHHVAVRRYYTATHDLKFYKGRYRHQDLAFTDAIKDNVVALPLHTVMTDAEIDYLFSTVRAYFSRD
jgi:dTDP-4-amino-4,6-dideoxygalactose transaminase